MIQYPIALTITDIISETNDSKTFVFEKPDGFTYQAGQYLTIQIGDFVTQTRSYSFSSIPSDSDIRITIKRVENGLFSRYALDNLKIGDRLTIIGVFGEFVIKNPKKEFIFFGAGSGIVPIFSIIKELLHQDTSTKISLYYSSSKPTSTIFFKDIFHLISAKHPNFHVEFYFSQNENAKPRRLNNFEIPTILENHSKDSFVYICGPVDYSDVVLINTRTFGIPSENIFTEDFLAYYEDGYEGEERLVPPDLGPHFVKIKLHNKETTLKVQYPKSILETAIENGLHLPYSCFSGQCGNCAAKKKSGEIFMIYNQVLTNDEISDGWILTCQGFPINGDAEIEY